MHVHLRTYTHAHTYIIAYNMYMYICTFIHTYLHEYRMIPYINATPMNIFMCIHKTQ